MIRHGSARATAPLIDVADLRIALRRRGGETRLVGPVSFSIDAGETLALVGESGSGKSLTAAALVRLFGPNGRSRDLTATGATRFRTRDGRTVEIGDLDERALEDLRGREIGLISQDPLNALNPTMRVGDQVIEARLRHLGEGRDAARAATRRLFLEAGFRSPEAVLDLHPHQLSGGMRQRVMIAVALAAEPRLIVADEPTTALDVTVQSKVLATLARLRRERGLGMLFISHDLTVVSRLADRLAVMYCGGVVESGPAARVLSRPRHPYTRDLLGSVPRLDRRPMPLRSIEGTPADPLHPPTGCAYHPRCREARAGVCDRLAPIAASLAGEADHAVACHAPLAVGSAAMVLGRREALRVEV